VKNITNFILIHFLAIFISFSAFGQTPNSSYTIQSGDWLSKISAQAYNNPHLYYKIVEGTNAKAISDARFRQISSVHNVEVGQRVWIPALETASAIPEIVDNSRPSTNLTGIPKSNCEIRLWYNFQVVAIGKINEKWEKDGIDLKTRAEKAYQMRHDARVNARFMMQSSLEVKALQARDLVKYGNPNGPTFDYLLKKNTDKGSSMEEAYQSIIDSSSRTDRKYNEDCK